jgi:hypothetical protein
VASQEQLSSTELVTAEEDILLNLTLVSRNIVKVTDARIRNSRRQFSVFPKHSFKFYVQQDMKFGNWFTLYKHRQFSFTAHWL